MAFVISPHGRWPNGQIKYRFLTCPQHFKATVRRVMDRWEAVIQNASGRRIVEFVETDRHDPSHLKISKVGEGTTAGCVGTWSGTNIAQIILCNLGPDIGNYPHEMGHVIGLGHEHMRPDSELQPTTNFGRNQMRNEREKCFSHGNYDMNSIMHYSGRKLADNFTVPRTWHTRAFLDKVSAMQVHSGTWEPSKGDLDAIIYMYG